MKLYKVEELQQEMRTAAAEAVKKTFTEFNDKTEARYFSWKSRKNASVQA